MSNTDDQVSYASPSRHSASNVARITCVAYNWTLNIVEATVSVISRSTMAFNPSAACLLPRLDVHFQII